MAATRLAPRWSNPITSSPSIFICRTCRSRLPPSARQFQTSQPQLARAQERELLDDSAPRSNPFAPGLGESDDGQRTQRGRRRRSGGDPGYTPAKTIDGLDWVGSKKWLEKMRDPKDRFEGWSRAEPAKVRPDNVEYILEKITSDAFGGAEPAFEEASRLKVQQSVAKVTGIRLPDIQAQRIKSIKDLKRALMTKPKEQKFSETFARGRGAQLRKLPNVTISARRVTMVDKENQRGRWKVIEQALLARGLPVLKKDATRQRRLL
ncbi:hypothetical protein BDZ85DRAFT_316699 [Elsinoe ampelina]|uniref:Ribosomal subunit 39S-domain-containing protein n=1 Tax=Elsinoe ampelina TaxID=302913 RepID=A0A6A6GII5_9PEZI|nr:hypothetical protein BDZ85DRAFT_316699 [Elsinoe ampelina]